MMVPLSNGLVHLISTRSALDTMSVLEAIVVGKGFRNMARIDHAKEAAEAGLQMLPAALLIFGSPYSGTPVMIASPAAAVDLPLKVLVWQDVEGRVWISYKQSRLLAGEKGDSGEPCGQSHGDRVDLRRGRSFAKQLKRTDTINQGACDVRIE